MLTDTAPTSALRPHPKNVEIYGDEADDGLIESIRRSQWIKALVITHDRRIISGHRRWDAAKKLGWERVPIEVFGSDNELEILDRLLRENVGRIKTGEQIGREALANETIEAELARQRMLAGKRTEPTDPVQNSAQGGELPPRRAPAARERTAARIGVSHDTAKKAAAAVTALDKAKANGAAGAKDAEAIQRGLNKSVRAGYQTAQKAGYVEPKPPVLREAGLDERLITIDVWHGLTDDQKAQVLTRAPKSGSHFNEQKSPDIEWAMWSWNPVTGCRHDCTYCYARDIAEGSGGARTPFAQGFVPTFLPERLAAPRQTKVPERAAHDTNYGNVFTCSMADLFGRWVPREWIDAVLAVVRDNPQWRFLFLTKFPIRMQEFDFPDNAWVGTTVDAQARVANAEKAFAKVNAKVKWLSCEPLLEPLKFTRLDLFQWVVIGGSSRSSQTPEWRPPRSWVEHLERQARDAGCKVYEKTNLLERLREYPGQAEPVHISVPDAFKMPYLQRDVTNPAAYAVEVRR